MAEKVSKTARASRGVAKIKFVKRCVRCDEPMVATLVIHRKYSVNPGGMHWVCINDHRVRT